MEVEKIGSDGIRPPAHRGGAYAPAGSGNAECGMKKNRSLEVEKV
jgi:hypothetical protein